MIIFINLICYKIQTASLSSAFISHSTLSSLLSWPHPLFSLLLPHISHSSSLSPSATNHFCDQTPLIQSQIPINLIIHSLLTSTLVEYLLEFYYSYFILCRSSDNSFLNETDWSYSCFNVSSGYCISTGLWLFLSGLKFS
jgi:hypothetical protein